MILPLILSKIEKNISFGKVNVNLDFRNLATERLDVNAILAKYARASKKDGVKYYSAKHGV